MVIYILRDIQVVDGSIIIAQKGMVQTLLTFLLLMESLLVKMSAAPNQEFKRYLLSN